MTTSTRIVTRLAKKPSGNNPPFLQGPSGLWGGAGWIRSDSGGVAEWRAVVAVGRLPTDQISTTDPAVFDKQRQLQQLQRDAALLKHSHATLSKVLACNQLRPFGELPKPPLMAAKERRLHPRRSRCSFAEDAEVAEAAEAAEAAEVAEAAEAAKDADAADAADTYSGGARGEDSDDDAPDAATTYTFLPLDSESDSEDDP
jgi:hypothetical protein